MNPNVRTSDCLQTCMICRCICGKSVSSASFPSRLSADFQRVRLGCRDYGTWLSVFFMHLFRHYLNCDGQKLYLIHMIDDRRIEYRSDQNPFYYCSFRPFSSLHCLAVSCPRKWSWHSQRGVRGWTIGAVDKALGSTTWSKWLPNICVLL